MVSSGSIVLLLLRTGHLAHKDGQDEKRLATIVLNTRIRYSHCHPL